MTDFPSKHDGAQTGVKGVLADYQQAQLEQRQRRDQEVAAAKAAMPQHRAPSNLDQTMFTKDERDPQSDSDLDDDDDDDQIFKEYREARMAELAQAGFGVLKDATPDEYVDIVEEHAESGASVVVILVNGSGASRRLAEMVRAEASTRTNAIFLRVQAHDCGFADAHVVPILLAYRHGELKHNLVRVVDQFADPLDFERQDVKKLLDKVFM